MAPTAPNSEAYNYKPPSEEVKRHFQSEPWAIKLFSDPDLHPFADTIPQTGTQYTFIGSTLNTESTLVTWQHFHKIGSPGAFPPAQVLGLYKLGSGLNGHSDTCHGGFVSTLMDEIIGSACIHYFPTFTPVITAYLKTEFKAPVPTPGCVLCRGWVEKIEGKKIFARGSIEDGDGKILATGEALFLAVKFKKNQIQQLPEKSKL